MFKVQGANCELRHDCPTLLLCAVAKLGKDAFEGANKVVHVGSGDPRRVRRRIDEIRRFGRGVVDVWIVGRIGGLIDGLAGC
jgi:hypothetical protein